MEYALPQSRDSTYQGTFAGPLLMKLKGRDVPSSTANLHDPNRESALWATAAAADLSLRVGYPRVHRCLPRVVGHAVEEDPRLREEALVYHCTRRLKGEFCP
jgi:hypothetical protein